MALPLAKWLMRKYVVLWNEYEDEPFTFEQVKKLLKDDNPSFIIVMLHELRKAGWLESKDNPDDTRKSIYTLRRPEDTISEIEV